MKRRIAVLVCGLSLAGMGLFAQDQPPPPQQTFPPEQLDSLVAPIALYPDSLLSQVLVASTYPLELVEADQWLSRNGNLQGTALVDAAKQQNWDPSIQALVVFPDVVKRLNSDVRWTTDLGNAFLAQQADVMAAVQRMRARARDNGKLNDTPQERVVTQDQDGQQAIEIQPTDPQVVYVPVYNPDYFWGPPPPDYGWPGLYYPGIGVGWGWGFGINIGGYFGGGWGGWGWSPGWFDHGIMVNNYFMHRYGYREFGDRGGFRGSEAWEHDPGHRLGVPYANRGVAERFQGGGGFRGGNQGSFAGNQGGVGGGQRGFAGNQGGNQGNVGGGQRGGFVGNQGGAAGGQAAFGRSAASGRGAASAAPSAPAQNFRNQQFEQRNNNHSAFGGVENGGRARMQSDHGFSSMGSQRSAPAMRSFGGGGGGGGRPAGGGGGGAPRGGRGR